MNLRVRKCRWLGGVKPVVDDHEPFVEVNVDPETIVPSTSLGDCIVHLIVISDEVEYLVRMSDQPKEVRRYFPVFVRRYRSPGQVWVERWHTCPDCGHMAEECGPNPVFSRHKTACVRVAPYLAPCGECGRTVLTPPAGVRLFSPHAHKPTCSHWLWGMGGWSTMEKGTRSRIVEFHRRANTCETREALTREDMLMYFRSLPRNHVDVLRYCKTWGAGVARTRLPSGGEATALAPWRVDDSESRTTNEPVIVGLCPYPTMPEEPTAP